MITIWDVATVLFVIVVFVAFCDVALGYPKPKE